MAKIHADPRACQHYSNRQRAEVAMMEIEDNDRRVIVERM
jgi:hypothetical protein